MTSDKNIGKISGEPARTVLKTELAIVQLEEAISLFLSEKYVPSITLAGAADAIFSGLLDDREIKPVADQTWASIEKTREITGLPFAGNISKKEAFLKWNLTRNKLKHHDPKTDSFTFHPIDDSFEAISRAMADAALLQLVPKNKFEFESYTIEAFFT